jgi:hypothetical protein
VETWTDIAPGRQGSRPAEGETGRPVPVQEAVSPDVPCGGHAQDSHLNIDVADNHVGSLKS